jgi:CBS domain-containing protein
MMKVDSILQSKGNRVVSVRPTTSIRVVIGRMTLEHIGAVVVSRDGQTAAGILSERDVARGLTAHGAAVFELTAGDLMAPAIATCTRRDSVKEIMVKMTKTRMRHLLVLENGLLCGVVSVGDVVKSRLREVEFEANVLQDAHLATH